MKKIFLAASRDHRVLTQGVEPHIVPRLEDVLEQREDDNVFKQPSDGFEDNAPYVPRSLSDLYQKPEGEKK